MDIVIIDDTPFNITLMEGIITAIAQTKTISFTNPVVGLAWCLKHEPDLIVLDYAMPEMNGVEVIQKLRAEHHLMDTPILMVTASTERQIRYDALKQGANDFINKPIDRYEFEPRVRNMLALRQAHLATRDRASLLQQEVSKAVAGIYERERETVMRLARAAEFRDPETGSHIQRMAYYSDIIARELGLDSDWRHTLLFASPMHDVGKLGIPDRILFKPATLTPEEMAIMQQHTTIGYSILNDSTSPVLQMAASIALSHHEKYDGTGYPNSLHGEDIPIEGRIVAAADVVDALASRRPYKEPWPMPKIEDYLKAHRGTHFDARCVDALLDCMPEIIAINERYNDTAEEQAVYDEMQKLAT